MYLHTKTELSMGKGFQKLEHQRETDTQTVATEDITTPHSWVI